jgi:hypothetical protein
MKSVRRIRLLAAVSLALTIPPAIEAEAHCPENIASVTPRFVQHALIVIPVRINQSGPFDFIVDTGSQVTVIDPLLAAELSLKAQGRVGLFPFPALRRRPQPFWIPWKPALTCWRNHPP